MGGVDHGIILARAYIPDETAAFGYLKGNNRGPTADSKASSRMNVAWNTASGAVSFTVTGGELTKGATDVSDALAAHSRPVCLSASGAIR